MSRDRQKKAKRPTRGSRLAGWKTLDKSKSKRKSTKSPKQI